MLPCRHAPLHPASQARKHALLCPRARPSPSCPLSLICWAPLPARLPAHPQYAGNVIVFSHGKLYHGDWFGGVRADNAAAFLDALLNCKVGGRVGPRGGCACVWCARVWRVRVAVGWPWGGGAMQRRAGRPVPTRGPALA